MRCLSACPRAENITCLTRLDHNRAVGQVGGKAGEHLLDWSEWLSRLHSLQPAECSGWLSAAVCATAIHRLHESACIFIAHAPPQLAERSGVHNTKVKNVIIWGNHSSTQVRD